MLRSSLTLLNVGMFSVSLPAVQQVLGVAQQCCSYATKSTKSAPYVKDAEKAKAKAKAKADKEKPKPKRAPSAYNLFVKDKAAGLAAGTAADRMKILAQQWNSMSTADKAPYVEMAAEGTLEANKAKQAAKKPPSAYNIYFKEQYPQFGAVKVTEAAKQIGSMWKGLSDAEKQRYKDAAEPALQAWKAQHGKL